MNKKNTYYLTIIFILALFQCSKSGGSKIEGNKATLVNLFTFTVGSVDVNQKPVKSGQAVSGDQLVRVGSGSLADIQVRGFKSEITLRSRTTSEIFLYSRIKDDKKYLMVFIKKGDLLFSVKKLQKDEVVVAYTPSMKAVVVGTQFKIVVKEDATTNIKVADGSVEVNQSSPALETILNSEETNSGTKEKINKLLGESLVIESGKETTFSNSKVKEALKDPELLKLLESPELKNIKIPSETPQNAELKKQLADLEAKLPESSAIAEAKLQVVKESNFKDLQKEASEIVSVQDDGKKTEQELKSEIDTTLKANNTVLLATMGKVLGKGAETLILKGGQQVTGIIFQTGNNYNVKTPQGDLQFPESQVSGLRF